MLTPSASWYVCLFVLFLHHQLLSHAAALGRLAGIDLAASWDSEIVVARTVADLTTASEIRDGRAEPNRNGR